MQQRNYLSYLYAGLSLGVLLLILVGNAWLRIEDTREKLVKVYWKQTEIISDTISLSAKNAIAQERVSSNYLNFYAKNLAQTIEEAQKEKPLTQKRLDEIRKNNYLIAISLYNSLGHIELISQSKKAKNAKSNSKTFTFEVGRKFKKGSILLSFGEEKIFDIRTKEALQKLTKSLQEKNLIEYISFYGPNLMNLADTNNANIGKPALRKEIGDSIQNKSSFFFPEGQTYELITYFHINEATLGAFHLGLSTKEIDHIYQETIFNTVLFSGAVFLVAIILTIFTLRFKSRYLYKLDLIQKKMQENEKLVSLGNLAAGVAHEVRNPLNSISITIQRLQLEFQPRTPKDDPTSDDEDYQGFLSLMKKEVNRLNQIITDFLSFAKPFSPKPTEFSISTFLQESTNLFQQEATQKGVEVITDFQLKEDLYNGDEEKLKQVFLNLLQNALEATEAGKKITVKAYQNKLKEWCTEIIDEGEGISPEKLRHIFDIYFTTKENGTGLGLYISRKIIQSHAGHIELIPNSNQGISAIVSLPKHVF